MAKYPVVGATAGEVDIPDQSSGGGSSGGSEKWAWEQLFLDPPKYLSRVLAVGYDAILPIAKGAWPPGYRVPNGQKGGGYPASGTSAQGTEPIRLCPPPTGTGRIKFVTTWKMTVVNQSSSTVGSFACGLGVVWPSEFNKPMWPYLGVAHDQEVDNLYKTTIRGGDSLLVMVNRLDIVDNDFIKDQPAPNWPNWEMNLSSNGNKMYPAIGPAFKNTGSTSLMVTDIHIFGVVC